MATEISPEAGSALLNIREEYGVARQSLAGIWHTQKTEKGSEESSGPWRIVLGL